MSLAQVYRAAQHVVAPAGEGCQKAAHTAADATQAAAAPAARRATHSGICFSGRTTGAVPFSNEAGTTPRLTDLPGEMLQQMQPSSQQQKPLFTAALNLGVARTASIRGFRSYGLRPLSQTARQTALGHSRVAGLSGLRPLAAATVMTTPLRNPMVRATLDAGSGSARGYKTGADSDRLGLLTTENTTTGAWEVCSPLTAADLTGRPFIRPDLTDSSLLRCMVSCSVREGVERTKGATDRGMGNERLVCITRASSCRDTVWHVVAWISTFCCKASWDSRFI